MTTRWDLEFFDFMTYPTGEPHVNISEAAYCNKDFGNYLGTTSAIIWKARDYNDLASMVTAWRALKRRGGVYKKFVVPYFPFGRHDRRRDEWDTDPLQMALDIVRPMMDEGCLITIDPHSDVSGVIPHITQTQVVERFLLEHEGLFGETFHTIVIPDAGATKKAYDWTFRFPHAEVIQGFKKRNMQTGELTGFGIENADKPRAHGLGRVLVVDDICDGGGTFLGLAGVLPPNDGITLLTSHGLFPKGTEHLVGTFDLWTLDAHFNGGNLGVEYLDTKELVNTALRTSSIR